MWHGEKNVSFRVIPRQVRLDKETVDIDSAKDRSLIAYLILQADIFRFDIIYCKRINDWKRRVDTYLCSEVKRVNVGLSSALIGSGMVFDFEWLKQHMHECKTFAEDKELEAILARDNIFVDYSDDIYVYDEKTARQDILIRQRSRWFHAQILAFSLITKDFNIRKINLSYIDKVIQWIPFPRPVRFLLIFLMILFWSVVSFPVAIKWYCLLIIKIGTYLLAIPRNMYTQDFFVSITKLPSMMIALLRSYTASICRVKKKDMSFNNTPHHITKKNNHE